VYVVQESIPRNLFRQAGNRFRGSVKRSTNTVSVLHFPPPQLKIKGLEGYINFCSPIPHLLAGVGNSCQDFSDCSAIINFWKKVSQKALFFFKIDNYCHSLSKLFFQSFFNICIFALVEYLCTKSTTSTKSIVIANPEYRPLPTLPKPGGVNPL
jgi:hypothetical protein